MTDVTLSSVNYRWFTICFNFDYTSGWHRSQQTWLVHLLSAHQCAMWDHVTVVQHFISSNSNKICSICCFGMAKVHKGRTQKETQQWKRQVWPNATIHENSLWSGTPPTHSCLHQYTTYQTNCNRPGTGFMQWQLATSKSYCRNANDTLDQQVFLHNVIVSNDIQRQLLLRLLKLSQFESRIIISLKRKELGWLVTWALHKRTCTGI